MFKKSNRSSKSIWAGIVSLSLLLGGVVSTSSYAASTLTIPATDPDTTIKVLSFMNKADIQTVLDAFAKEHPTIKVDFQTVPFNDLQPTVDARVSSKSADLDVYWADQPRVSALAARGTALDITSAFSKYQSTFDASPWASGLYNGKLYALPIANSTQMLFYNVDLLKKAGITPPSASISDRMTWEDLVADAKKAVGSGAKYGLLFHQFDRYYQLEALPVSKGGGIGAQGKGNLIPNVANKGWIDALTWYGQLFKNKISPRGMTPEQVEPAFLAGQAAYMVGGPWFLPDLNVSKLNWGVAPHPYFKGGKAVTANGSWSLAINPYSKNQEASAIFLKFMAIDGGSGYIKYRNDPELAATPEAKKLYFAKDVFATPQGKQAAAIIDYETSKTGVGRVQTVGYIEFETIMNAAFSDIRNGADPGKVLREASNKLRKAWAIYK
jgi:ABC-type glycerol-3-phosphate transport system substrate-binding protein